MKKQRIRDTKETDTCVYLVFMSLINDKKRQLTDSSVNCLDTFRRQKTLLAVKL